MQPARGVLLHAEAKPRGCALFRSAPRRSAGPAPPGPPGSRRSRALAVAPQRIPAGDASSPSSRSRGPVHRAMAVRQLAFFCFAAGSPTRALGGRALAGGPFVALVAARKLRGRPASAPGFEALRLGRDPASSAAVVLLAGCLPSRAPSRAGLPPSSAASERLKRVHEVDRRSRGRPSPAAWPALPARPTAWPRISRDERGLVAVLEGLRLESGPSWSPTMCSARSLTSSG